MIIQLEKQPEEKSKQLIIDKLEKLGFKTKEIFTSDNHYLVSVGKSEFDIRSIGHLEGVIDIHLVTDDYKLVSRQWKVEPTAVDLGDGVVISERDFTVMAGPCSIESEEQVEKITDELKKHKIKILRGGVYKPRSSPYSFRGLGLDGLKMMYAICRKKGIKIITEVMEMNQIEAMLPYVDIFQVGARNSQNFNLLEALGKSGKPIMIKRGISGTIDELLYSAEYVFSCGNEKLMLCERGIRTYEKLYRNTLDLNAIPILKEKTHLPVIVDPSHGIGIRRFVEPMALAGIVCGADGLIVETHHVPEKAMSDGQQTLNFRELDALIQKANKIKATMQDL